MLYAPTTCKPGTRKNLHAYFTYLVRKFLHQDNICWRNHEIDIEVVSPSKGRLRVFIDSNRVESREQQVLVELDRLADYGCEVPQMRWMDTGNRDFLAVPVEDE